MLLNLSAEEQIKVMTMHSPVEVEVKLEAIRVSHTTSDGLNMQPTTSLMDDIIRNSHAIVDYFGGQWRISTPVIVTIIPFSLVFLGLNSHGTPILEIEGEAYSGYSAISHALFGYYRRDIREIVKPYLYKEFSQEQLKFVEYRNFRGRQYPVFTYGESQELIKGAKGLQKMFPQLTSEQIKNFTPELSKRKQRHEEIIEQWDMCILPPDAKGKRFYEVGDRYFEYKTEVIGFLRGEGTKIGQTTAKKLFAHLESEALQK